MAERWPWRFPSDAEDWVHEFALPALRLAYAAISQSYDIETLDDPDARKALATVCDALKEAGEDPSGTKLGPDAGPSESAR